MAEKVLSGTLVLFDQVDISEFCNSVVIDYGAEPLDRTALPHTTRNRVGGLKTAVISAAGFHSSAEPDSSFEASVGAADQLMTVADSTTEGAVSYMLRSVLSEYMPLEGSVGDIAGMRISAAASLGDLYRGFLGHQGAETATGNSTGFQLGAIAAGQSIYVGTHIIAFAGTAPTLDVIIQSDDNSGFTSATDRITFAQETGLATAFASLAGAVTDDWWRVRYVIGGSAGQSFTFTTTLSIQ